MGWSFRKSKKLGPLRFTVSKRGLGVSVGGKAGRVGIGASGRTTLSAGVAGLRYQKVLSNGKRRSDGATDRPAETSPTTGADDPIIEATDIPIEALTPEEISFVILARRLWWHRALGIVAFFGGFALVIWGSGHGEEIRWALLSGSLLVTLSTPWLLVSIVRTWWNNRKLKQLAIRICGKAA